MTNTTDIQLPRLYDMNLRYIDRLQPTKVGYELRKNKVSTATIDMDGTDKLPTIPKICQFVELFETYGSVGKFRVESLDIERDAGESQTFYLEHAITTLHDGCIDGYLELGGTGVHTREVLTALLALQPKTYWALGDCDFDCQFQHSFENDDLLTAIFSVPASFTDEYIWTYDTDAFPFVLNLKRVESGDASELRMNRNVKSVKIAIDREPLCTRIYPKGYGEGTNQLTIADVNGGVRYLDADTQGAYGIVCKQWPDTTFTDPSLLKSVATTVLNRLKEPLVTTVFEAYEIYELTGESLDRFYIGKLVRAPLPAFGTTIRERVVSIAKKDVYGHNEDATLTLTNKSSDVTDDLAELVRKATIGELYSQGATNMYAEHYADNASPDKPLVCKFWIDEACVHINAVILEYTTENFRAYSKGVEAGGGSTQTSSSGGRTTVTHDSKVLSNGFTTGAPLAGEGASSVYTEANEASLSTKSAGGHTHYMYHYHNGSSHTHSFSGSDGLAHYHYRGGDTYTGGVYGGLTASISGKTESSGGGTTSSGSREYTDASGSHSHAIESHTHKFSHFHRVTVGFTIPGQSINIPSHTHSVDIPEHKHDVEYGIFEGGTASSVTVKVDGNAVPKSAVSGGSVDLVAYLAKDDGGKITRNTWHRIEITPNALTRIVSDVFVKTFIRSIGGGTY